MFRKDWDRMPSATCSRRAWLAAAGAAFLFVGAMNARAGSDVLKIDQAWARAAPIGRTTAVYFSISNSGPADKLTTVATDIAAHAGLHKSSLDDKGVMTMTSVQALDVPAGATVTLAPGGYHVMLMDLKQPLKVGDHFALTLSFEKAGVMSITVPVKDAMGDMHQMHTNPMGNM